MTRLLQQRDVAILRYANLRYADLSGADLRHADLSDRADLRGANLTGADFTGANFGSGDLNHRVLFTGGTRFCHTIMPDGHENNSDC